jgi:NDP-sugar pyrophosphorylase family protein
MEKTIIILAAGIGSRYGGLKQMDPIGPSGEFIIDYSVYDAIRAGFNKVIFIINHVIEHDFKATVGERVSKKINIDYTFQEIIDIPANIEINDERKKPWGTVHALLTCMNSVNGPFIAINADDFYGKESYRIISNHLDTMSSNDYDYCMVGYKLSNTLSSYGSVTRGVCKSSQNDYLNSIDEIQSIYRSNNKIFYEDDQDNRNELDKDTIVSMNFWGFTPTVFHLFKEEFIQFIQLHGNDLKSELVIPTVINTLIEQDKIKVKALKTTSHWFGITNPADKEEVIAKLNALIKSGAYPDNLWG